MATFIDPKDKNPSSKSREMVKMLLGTDNLQQKFEDIDTDGNGSLSFSEVYAQVSECAAGWLRKVSWLMYVWCVMVVERPAKENRPQGAGVFELAIDSD